MTMPMAVERMVMTTRAVKAPRKTGERGRRMDRTAAMKNVLSPSSVAIINDQELKKAGKKERPGDAEEADEASSVAADCRKRRGDTKDEDGSDEEVE